MVGGSAVECPRCRKSNLAGSRKCASCGSWLEDETLLDVGSSGNVAGSGDDATVLLEPAPRREPAARSDATLTSADVDQEWTQATQLSPGSSGTGTGSGSAPGFEVGSVVGDRYEIVKLLGEGGMGAVYKAHDQELERMVALKIVRPEMAKNPKVLRRFKQELILARKITHRNVIRIFDLGVAGGVRFITMEFVEGRDMSSIIEERRKFPPGEAVGILRQVCAALAAAHAEGVVHRDLKPQNIMIEEKGRVCVMDFGLARSLEATGLTQVGAIMGTPAYMAPEQAKGLPADARTDLYALGIIAYEMLTGTVPFQAESTLASLLVRTQGPPPTPMSVEPSVPQALNDIVMKLLQTDAEARYQSAAELDKDLSDWQEGNLARQIVTPPMAMIAPSETKKWVGLAIAGALVLGAAVWGGIKFWQKPAGPVAPTTVIIADFNNHTGDSVFSGTMESTLKLALEGAAFISAYDRSRVRELGVPAVSGTLDEVKAQSIAASQGLNVVVTGALDLRGTEYRLSLRALQTVTGKVITQADETAANKDQVLFAVTKLGAAVRKALGDSASESSQRLSMETLSAASLEAVHEYAAGLDTLSAGRFPEAQSHLSRAVDLDPNFGMAYTIMASAARNQGRFQDADRFMKEALKHIDGMTERERYRTRAYTYLLSGDHQKCVEEYSALLEKYPADTGAYTNIAVCLVHQHNVPKAMEYSRRAVAILPKRAIYHANLAMNLAYGGDFAGAGKSAAEAIKLGYSNGYLIQAFAALGQEQPAEAAAAYQNLAKRLPSDAATGLADLAIYEGRYKDAVDILEKGIAADTSGRTPDNDAAATKYWMLARVQLSRGQKPPALAAIRKALELNNAIQTRFVAAEVFTALGDEPKARELASALASEPQIEPRSFAKLIEGEIALKKGDGMTAAQRFSESINLLDTWLGRFALGQAYLAAGKFLEADSEFDRCIKRRGEALALFLDLATYGFYPPVYYYQGRAREGMNTQGFAASYKKYLGIRGKAGEDPLVADVRRRLGQ